jgi:hypothetical protein
MKKSAVKLTYLDKKECNVLTEKKYIDFKYNGNAFFKLIYNSNKTVNMTYNGKLYVGNIQVRERQYLYITDGYIITDYFEGS